MTTHDWPRLFELFERGLDVPPDRREAWLTQVASGNPALRRELERLFHGHEAAGVLDRSPHDPEPDVARLLADALRDRYQVDDQLGRGGSAIVFRAREQKHDRRVVIKVLDPVIAAVNGPDRFRREVRIAATLSHPHILGLIDSGEAAGLLYYVMPHVDGETLRARLDRLGRLPLPSAMRVLTDIASALAHAHAASVVHRDLKPENVLLSGDHAFLMDFGVATYVADARPGVQLTLQGQAVGTPAYMSPEQRAATGMLDARADVYAWGLLAHEVLLGVAPSPGAGPNREITLPGVPLHVAAVVSDALAPDPDERPSDASALVRQLERPAPEPTTAPRRRRVSLPVAAATIVALVLAVGLWRALARTVPRAAPIGLPVVVAPFQNETGDATLATWGRLAGDWITQGLQETGLGPVVPWPAVVRATRVGEQAASMGPVEVAQQTGAGTVVTGSYYEVGDSLRVSAQVVDAASGRILAAFPSLTAPRQHPEQALAPLRDRAMGTFAVLMDQRLPPAAAARSRPPTYEAYLAFDAGLRRFVNQDYTGAIPELRKAVTLDTFFMSPRMTIAASWWNEGRMDSVGVVLEELRVRRSALSPLLALSFDALDAWYHNDLQRAYELHTEAARRAPDSQAGYNLAFTALAIDRPADALRILDGLDPSSGALRDWSSYWTQLAHALHMTGNHARELEAARELARRFPSRRVALTLEVRALAAVRDTAAIDSVLNESLSLPPSTYWSQGSAMVMAGEELLAHGYPASAGRYFERAIQWCREQMALDPGFRNHREWLATALYDTGRWREAHEVFTALAREYPTSRHYLGWTALTTARTTGQDRSEAFSNPAPWARASNLLTRGRIAAARRERDRARLLLTEAVGLGIEGLPWLHATAARDLLELGTDRTLLPSSLRAGLPLAAH